MSKVIIVLGNGGSGKTLLSYFLGQLLCKDGKRVMIMSTENTAPSLQYVLPEDKKGMRSLGRLLSLALISQKDILDNMQTTSQNSNLGFLSYAAGESSNSYPEIAQSNLATCFELLSSVVDYVIVDTQASRNAIDMYALKHADIKLCIATADLKGLAYRKVLEDEDITHLLYNDNPYNPYEDISHTYRLNIKYHVPQFKALHTLFNTEPLSEISCPVKYEKLLMKLIKEVINVERAD